MNKEEKLEEKFRKAEMFDEAELNGEYRVKMLSGNFFMGFFMNLMGDSKVFNRAAGQVVGHNVLSGFVKWGHFFVKKAICPATGLGVVEINYGTEENLLSQNIRDHIRRTAPGEYIGKFNVEKNGKLVFSGYFSLTKV